MSSAPAEPVPGGTRLHLLVQPRASRSEITGLHDGRIRVRLAAPPVEGAANKALLRYLSKQLGIPPSSMELVSGTSARRKTVLVRGVTADQVVSRLGLNTYPSLDP